MRTSSKAIAPSPISDRPVEQQETEADPNKYKIVSVRLRVAEFEEFSEQVSAFGLTHSLALRITVRRIGGFLEVDGETKHRLAEILRAIGTVSRNLSQLNESCRQNEGFDMEDLARQRREFGTEFAQLDAMLRSILNVSHRRSDGRVRLQESLPQ